MGTATIKFARAFGHSGTFPVVKRFHLMALVDATNDHHSHQNRAFIDVTWIACVKRGSVEVGSPLKGKLSSNLNEAWRGGADYVAEIRIFVLSVHSSRPEKLSMVEDVECLDANV